MGFLRFRRSIRILPGLRLNFGKRSVSVSAGVRGAHVTVGTTGTRTTVGVPGTGISYTELSKPHGEKPLQAVEPPSEAQPAADAPGLLSWLFVLLVVAALVILLVLSGCSLFRPPPDFGPGSAGHSTTADDIDAARDRAIVALVGCVKLYATSNAGAAAAAAEIADASVSHCGIELQAIDIADREGIRHSRDVSQLAYGTPGLSAAEAERTIKQLHEDAIRAARGVALETVIALRNPGK